MGALLLFDPHKMGQFMISSKAKVHLFSTCYCTIHLELQCPTHIPAGQNFLPTSALDSCQPSWKLALEMYLQLGRQVHCFHTHIHLLNAKELFTKWEKNTLAQLFLQELPRGIWRWARGIDLVKGGENLQLMWSEWDRLSAGMTADDGVIKYLP